MNPPRVLLVDDDLDMLECLEIGLHGEFETSTARNGGDALRLMHGQSFDAVVLDLMMPEVDGISVLQELQAQGLTVPVLLASAMPDLEATARVFGARGCLSKPYPLDLLIQKLHELVPADSQHPERHEAKRTSATLAASGHRKPAPAANAEYRSRARSATPLGLESADAGRSGGE